MKRIRKSAWLPWTLLLVGTAFYVYYGVEWGAWTVNLPNLIIYVVIILTLYWVLRKREEMEDRHDL